VIGVYTLLNRGRCLLRTTRVGWGTGQGEQPCSSPKSLGPCFLAILQRNNLRNAFVSQAMQRSFPAGAVLALAAVTCVLFLAKGADAWTAFSDRLSAPTIAETSISKDLEFPSDILDLERKTVTSRCTMAQYSLSKTFKVRAWLSLPAMIPTSHFSLVALHISILMPVQDAKKTYKLTCARTSDLPLDHSHMHWQ
jgi:hypothetical protein